MQRPNEPKSGSGARPASSASARDRARRRSVTFLEREGDRWSVFLATYAGEDGRWRGFFTFRTGAAAHHGEEIRTADVFVENSEAEVDARARSLGHPLLLSLLESALHTHERKRGAAPDVAQWFRSVLATRSEALVEPPDSAGEPTTLPQLRSLYASYRIDQVAHLIALLDPGDFSDLVERILDGRTIDFRASDRLQLAMLVVQELERRLPLPPFEVWAEDYVARVDVYQRYTHALHRDDTLP